MFSSLQTTDCHFGPRMWLFWNQNWKTSPQSAVLGVMPPCSGFIPLSPLIPKHTNCYSGSSLRVCCQNGSGSVCGRWMKSDLGSERSALFSLMLPIVWVYFVWASCNNTAYLIMFLLTIKEYCFYVTYNIYNTNTIEQLQHSRCNTKHLQHL